MDPNAWQAYQAAAAYTNRFNSSSNQDDHPPSYHNPLSLLSQYQHNSLLPPSLLAAQQHKSQSQLANSLLTPPVTPVSTAWEQRRSVIEAKASQPAFPGQPPPLQDVRRGESPAFPGQPPPRQSSQPRSQIFPGSSNHYSQQQDSGSGYGNNYSPGAPSPQSYNNVQSPQDSYHSHSNQRREERERQQRELERQRIEADIRERQKEKERQERHRIAEERREQERIRQEQEFRREQERIRQEKEREERVRKEQEERKRREREKQEQERIRREHERIRQEQEKRKREEEEKRRREEERRREQERIRQEQERIRQEQERIAHERKMQEERDLGLARLSAMGALNDLGEENNGYNNQHYEQEQSNNFNINMFNQFNQQNMIKQEQHEQKPLVNQFNTWINRANELLDLSSSDSRDTNTNNDNDSSNFIPQILMNPWDPQQPPMMTFAPIANAMQQYQQQWLSQYHQAAGMLNNEEGSFPLGKFKVLCIAPDEDMGFLINLPPPCNLLFQQEALVGKKVDSPFIMVFSKFLKDPDLSNMRKNLTEAPDKPPPYIEPEEPRIKQEIKKEYVPPYTPKATHDPESKARMSSSGFSRSLEITPVRRSGASRSHHSRASVSSASRDNNTRPSHNSSSSSNSNSSHSRSRPVKRNVSDDEDELPEIPPELLRRETSRRKAKENLKSKLEAQEKLLMDQDDPTFNNPALDLEDSDDDAEWNPMKEAEKSGNKRKRGGDSSDEEEEDYEEFNNLHNVNNKKRRAYNDSASRKVSNNSESSHDTQVPEGEDFKVVT